MANEKQSGGKEDRSKGSGKSGNFADDPQRASEAGKKGGQHSHSGGSAQSGQSSSGRSQSGATKGTTDDEPTSNKGSKKTSKSSQ